MAERFFLKKPNSGGETNLRRDNLTLLTGPISSGKTSLLFQYAINVAAASTTARVVFICHRRKIETNPPFLSQGIESSSDLFDRIQMKYVDDEEGIRNYFAAFHLHVVDDDDDDDLPDTVLIDDFGDYFRHLTNSRGSDMAMARTVALCHNAIAYANGKKANCELVLSDTSHGDSTRSLFVYKRWIPTIFTIKGCHGGDGFFLLRSNVTTERSAKYSIALQYLIFEEMVDDDDDDVEH
ncbi:unnamed protein product [Cochlearia groenlandica]